MKYQQLEWRGDNAYSESFDDVYASSHMPDSKGVDASGNDGPHDDLNGNIDSLEGCNAGGAQGQFLHVFLEGNKLAQRWHRDGFSIAELGFGTGLNFLFTIYHWLKDTSVSPDARLHYFSVEKYPLSPADIKSVCSAYPELAELVEELLSVYPPAVRANHQRQLCNGRVNLVLCFTDVSQALQGHRLCADAWYLDGFTPSKNPQMWTGQVMTQIAVNSHEGSTFATYTASGEVRRNLQAAGFSVERVPGYGKKREMLRGRLQAAGLSPASMADAGACLLKDKPWLHPPGRLLQRAAGKTASAVIIGAGIAGLTVANALCRRGMQVTVVDRCKQVAMATSSNPVAIVYPRISLDDEVSNALFADAFCHAQYRLDSLQASNAGDVFWHKTGVLQTMPADRRSRILDQDIYCHDYLAAANGDCLEMKTAGFVLPGKLCEALVQECAGRVEFIQAEIDAIDYTGTQNQAGHWLCKSAGNNVCESGVVIIASNHEFADLYPGGYAWLDPAKVAGQSLAIAASASSRDAITQVINDKHYITPAIQGLHHSGASYIPLEAAAQFEATAESVDADRLTALAGEPDEALVSAFTRLSGENRVEVERVWSGIRGVSRNRMPLAGNCIDVEFFLNTYKDVFKGDARKTWPVARYHDGLYLSLAHGSRGFTTSFLVAEIIAAQVFSEPLPVEGRVLASMSLARVVLDQLKRG